MEEIEKDFNVPIYIVQEIVDYIELTAQRSLQMYEMGKHQGFVKACTGK